MIYYNLEGSYMFSCEVRLGMARFLWLTELSLVFSRDWTVMFVFMRR